MISTTTSDDEGDLGLWIEAFERGILLNAYVTNANSGDAEGPMTVFWHGEVTRERVKTLVDYAERLFREHDILDAGILFSYGKEEIAHGPVAQGLAGFFHEPADAYRAELKGRRGGLTVWANVQPQIAETEVENIGICFDRLALYEIAKVLVLGAFGETTKYGGDVAARLFDEIVSTVAAQKPPDRPLPGNAL